ncbi:DUF4202 domain-containing protein [Verrucomicrobiaceae bacterium N1E253]|uniref:DUF4202 domain-containing protein n=1 Tax=Oceaniferula marina TaxID=2748318 RepID=A0A851GHJ6_9BACT|nr:DUF4202 domain-containing protein [Oceaniferula marina]NWK55341.1 DUF4202 domain-containing protein [Oceaniferula marina]
MNEQQRIRLAFERFDAANAEDPNLIEVDGQAAPKELVFSRRLTDWVMALQPDASEALQLASRCQHLCRWQVPRSSQPMGRAGYLKWRAGLKQFHAEKSGEILEALGFDQQTIARVQELNLKKNLKKDAECQTIEDALCLVFLQYQFDDLIADTESEKMIRIVKKTWAKMSEQGQQAAMKLDYSPLAMQMLEQSVLPS